MSTDRRFVEEHQRRTYTVYICQRCRHVTVQPDDKRVMNCQLPALNDRAYGEPFTVKPCYGELRLPDQGQKLALAQVVHETVSIGLDISQLKREVLRDLQKAGQQRWPLSFSDRLREVGL